jgi:hypothetical protein
VDVKNIKCPLQWWEKHESMFPIVGLCAKQILGIVGSQIETQKKNSLARIFISKCCLQSKKLDKLIFVKNWPNLSKLVGDVKDFLTKINLSKLVGDLQPIHFWGRKLKYVK